MKVRPATWGAIAIGLIVAAGQLTARAPQTDLAMPVPAPAAKTTVPVAGASIGPDVIVAAINSVTWWASSGSESSFSVGTTACNVGTENLTWVEQPSNLHPVIAQSMYRLESDRFEQIGQSWLKHGFCALQFPTSPSCGTCSFDPTCYDYLTPGCSDPYASTTNGGQNGLGPKWQVNPHTGLYPTGPWAPGEGTGGDMRRRLRVAHAELEHAGAQYFVEAQYVHPGDAAAGNQDNNASYQEVTVTTTSIAQLGSSVREVGGVDIWKDVDPSVTVVEVRDQDNGLIKVGSKVWEDPVGTWNYEYAVYNMNSHQALQAFEVPVGAGANVSNHGFHDVHYHSGDGDGGTQNYEGTDWDDALSAGALTWKTALHADDPNANALRWGTTYNFRFQADTPPVPGQAKLTQYRTPLDLAAEIAVPSPVCPEDLSRDGMVGFADILMVISGWGTESGDVDGSGTTDFQDVLLVLSRWGPC